MAEVITEFKVDKSLLKELRQSNLDSYDLLVTTGSTSGSLIGFTLEGALVPAGWILDGRSQAIPFSGELREGIAEMSSTFGINREAVSFSRSGYSALEYTRKPFNWNGWTPEKGREAIDRYRQSQKDPKNQTAPYAYLPAHYETLIRIESARIAKWDDLSSQEQQFVSSPFPVIYGIPYRYQREISSRISEIKPKPIGWDEVFIVGKVEAQYLTVLVPRDKIEVVKAYFESKGLVSRNPYLPLEVFCFILEQASNLSRRHTNLEKNVYNLFTPHDYIDAFRRWELELEWIKE